MTTKKVIDLKRLLAQISMGCFVMVMLCDFSSADEQANKLFVEAYRLMQLARGAEKKSFMEAFKPYKDVMDRI